MVNSLYNQNFTFLCSIFIILHFLVASPRIELGSGASETLVLSIVLRGHEIKKLELRPEYSGLYYPLYYEAKKSKNWSFVPSTRDCTIHCTTRPRNQKTRASSRVLGIVLSIVLRGQKIKKLKLRPEYSGLYYPMYYDGLKWVCKLINKTLITQTTNNNQQTFPISRSSECSFQKSSRLSPAESHRKIFAPPSDR